MTGGRLLGKGLWHAGKGVFFVIRTVAHPYGFKGERYDRFAMAAMPELGLIYALIIAVGVPVLGFVSNTPEHVIIKRYIAETWMMVIPFIYWSIEVDGLVAQTIIFKVLEVERAEQQRSSMTLPYYGAITAFVLWVVGVASGGRWLSLDYGRYEAALILHTIVTSFVGVGVLYPLIGHYQTLSANFQRDENEVKSH